MSYSTRYAAVQIMVLATPASNYKTERCRKTKIGVNCEWSLEEQE